MWQMLIRGLIAGVIVIAVSAVSKQLPRLGALLLTLPVISIIAFVMTWREHHELPVIERLARETLVLVPLGLPFFVPLAFASRLGMGFGSAFAAGLALASITIGLWFWLGPLLS